jgi:hypothetical protein
MTPELVGSRVHPEDVAQFDDIIARARAEASAAFGVRLCFGSGC